MTAIIIGAPRGRYWAHLLSQTSDTPSAACLALCLRSRLVRPVPPSHGS